MRPRTPSVPSLLINWPEDDATWEATGSMHAEDFSSRVGWTALCGEPQPAGRWRGTTVGLNQWFDPTQPLSRVGWCPVCKARLEERFPEVVANLKTTLARQGYL